MRGFRMFCQRGSNSDDFFSFGEGRTEDPYYTKSGPSSAHQRNAIFMAFRYRSYDSPTMNAGLVVL